MQIMQIIFYAFKINKNASAGLSIGLRSSAGGISAEEAFKLSIQSPIVLFK